MAKTVNIIFLDIDGVLNSEYFYKVSPHYTWDLLNPYSVKLLNELSDKYNAKIVLISTWVKTYGIKTIKEVFVKNQLRVKVVGSIDISAVNKGEGIKEYLKNLKYNLKNVRYIVIDDEEVYPRNLVKTNPEYGLTEIEYKQADRYLSKTKNLSSCIKKKIK